MTFNSTNRKLASSTGYLRSKHDGWVCDHDIYLGIGDDKSNYEEISEEEYNLALKEEEEKRAKEEEMRNSL